MIRADTNHGSDDSKNTDNENTEDNINMTFLSVSHVFIVLVCSIDSIEPRCRTVTMSTCETDKSVKKSTANTPSGSAKNRAKIQQTRAQRNVLESTRITKVLQVFVVDRTVQ